MFPSKATFTKKSKLLVLLLFLVLWAEALSFISLTLISRKFPRLVYTSRHFSYPKLRKNLNDPLGWGSDKRQSSTAHLRAKSCRVLLFGDSFTESDTYEFPILNVDQTPENYLSYKTGCQVINYGVGGYGSDQAFLKFKNLVLNNSVEKGDIVFLNHVSENIHRNSNRNHRLLYSNTESTPLFKPVFLRKAANNFTVLPVPQDMEYKESHIISSRGYSKNSLEGENQLFVPSHLRFGSPAYIKFPFSYSLFRVFFNWHLYPRYFGLSSLEYFYRANSPELETLLFIINEFHQSCVSSQISCISMDLPVAADFKVFYSKGGSNTFKWQKNLEKKAQLRHYSFGDHLIKKTSHVSVDQCAIHDGSLDGGDGCNGHFNKLGYKLFYDYIAMIVNKKLVQD